MKRKLLSILLIVSLAMGLTTFAFAAEGDSSDYEMEGSILKVYNGPGGDVVIPDFVTDISMFAFHRDDITSVTIPGSIKNIANGAFDSCTGLQSVTLLDGIQEIWGGAFSDCTSLTSVTLPQSLTTIHAGWGGVFAGCTALKSINLPVSLKSLGSDAFNDCTNLTEAFFYGDAPEWEDSWGANSGPEDCTFYYIQGKTGWTSPEWNGIKTALFTPESTVQEPEKPTALQAHPNSSKILVDGTETAFDAYTFYDEKGNGTNYIKLRDIAYTLNNTAAQFEVGWDGNIILTTGKPYTMVGGEMASKGAEDKTAAPNSSTIFVNSMQVELSAYTIEGNNYFKLRDLGRTLGFNVSWDNQAGSILINTNEVYSGDN